MNLKERIRILAKSKGLSLPNLESELGFGNGTIVKWDKSTPNVDKLTKVADYFNVSIDYLLGRDNESNDDEEIRAIARNMKKLDSNKRKLLDDLIKTMSESADKELNK